MSLKNVFLVYQDAMTALTSDLTRIVDEADRGYLSKEGVKEYKAHILEVIACIFGKDPERYDAARAPHRYERQREELDNEVVTGQLEINHRHDPDSIPEAAEKKLRAIIDELYKIVEDEIRMADEMIEDAESLVVAAESLVVAAEKRAEDADMALDEAEEGVDHLLDNFYDPFYPNEEERVEAEEGIIEAAEKMIEDAEKRAKAAEKRAKMARMARMKLLRE